eukprot:13497117-Alexandrium_andersonii.AAC.1
MLHCRAERSGGTPPWCGPRWPRVYLARRRMMMSWPASPWVGASTAAGQRRDMGPDGTGGRGWPH